MKKTLALLISICLLIVIALPVGAENTEDIKQTIYLNSSGAPDTSNDGIVSNKTLSVVDGKAKITIETYTTGTVKIVTETKPADIVLVLDASGSMDDRISAGSGKDALNLLDKSYGATQDVYQAEINSNTRSLRYEKGEWQYKGNGSNGSWNSINKNTTVGDITIRKIDALKISVNKFIDTVYITSLGPDGMAGTADDIDNRIAIVKFAGKSTDTVGNDQYVEDRNSYNYSQIVFDITGVMLGSTSLKNAVVAIQASGATSADYGMAHANKIMNSIDTNRDSSKTVIMFTDGEPNHKTGFDEAVANSAILNSNKLKTNGVSVYTIGDFSDANNTKEPIVPENPGAAESEPEGRPNEPYKYLFSWYYKGKNYSSGSILNGTWNNGYEAAYAAYNYDLGMYESSYEYQEYLIRKAEYDKKKESYEEAIAALNNFNNDNNKTNRYMHYVSSNYKNAVSMENPGSLTCNENQNFYLTAGNQLELNDIFQTISSTVTESTVSLDETTIVKDIISDYFAFSEGADASSISVMTAEKTANGWDALTSCGLAATVNGKTVSVTGFDFTSNAVTENPKSDGTYGKKLVISFEIVLDKNHPIIGGNGINTNAEGCGIYSGDTCFATFTSPTADVSINYGFRTVDQSIYLTQDANLANSFMPSVKANGENNKFVDIIYTLKDGDNAVATYTILNGDTSGSWDAVSGGIISGLEKDKEYSVTCEVTPTTIGNASVISDTQSKTVFVFVPEIIAYDDEMYLGDEAINITDNTPLSSWNGTEYAPSPSGSVPTLAYEYYPVGLTEKIDSPNAYAPIETTDVNVKVIVGNKDITSLTQGDKNFTVNIKTCSLTITSPKASDDQQRFLYTVTGDKGNSYEVAITGSEKSRTLTGLPVDTYTVECKTNWAWSFSDFTNDHNGSVTLTKNKATDVIKFTAKYDDKWLSDEDGKENVFNPVL